MNTFWQDAVSIFETACKAGADGGAGELNIVIGEGGGLQIVAGEGWRPDALAEHYGALTVYQIKRQRGAVRVEGRRMGMSCLLQSAQPAAACHMLP